MLKKATRPVRKEMVEMERNKSKALGSEIYV
jgi:hypothetical protein